MRISECLTPGRCGFSDGATKHEAINELIEWAAESPDVTDIHDLTQAVWRREGLMSTGIGMGIAVPHVRIASVKKMVMAVAIHRVGLSDYGSMDGNPVHILVLIAAAGGQHTEYIQLLAQVVDLLKQESVRDALIRADSAEEIYQALMSDQER
jgi:mannitol/fructose-specific phosphotransferase system IIA component (Ntr-type)